jgi:hypothetical protein
MEAIMGRKEKALLIAIGANLFLVALKFFLAGVSSSVCIFGRFRWFYDCQKGRKSTNQGN